MTVYQCERCGRQYAEPWCDKDQRELTVVVDAAAPPVHAPAPPVDEVAAAIARQSAELAAAATPASAGSPDETQAGPDADMTMTVPPPPPRSVRPRIITPDVPPPLADAPSAPQREITGLAEFKALLDQGFKSVVICGGPKTGKSEIVNAFTKVNTIYRGKAQFSMLRATLRTEETIGATLPNEVWYQVASDKHVFLDPSGEFFRALSLEERQRLRLPDVTDEHFDFVRDAVRQLAGIILIIDLTSASGRLDRAWWRSQENDFTFVLPALRWLRFDKEARPPGMGVSINIAARVQKLRKLDVPVLVLFSKADRLDTLTNEQPLQFARRNLPLLHGALVSHAKRFRFDFCHTMIRKGDGDMTAERPCGVLLSLEWLLEDRFRWLPRVPTTWLGGGKR